MKKLYILFMITPLFVFGQHQHGEECNHVRGEHHQVSNDFQPNETQNRVFSTIPYQNSFESGFSIKPSRLIFCVSKIAHFDNSVGLPQCGNLRILLPL